MSRTMRAYRILEWERAPELVDVPVPTPARGEVLVRVAGNGLCHSDTGMWRMPGAIGEAIGWAMPFTLGHEVAGRVAAVGDGVTGIGDDDAVALVSPTSCGTCGDCVRGHDNVCRAGTAGRGYGRDGGLAEYVLARAPRDLLPLGSLDPVVAGPLTDAGATSYHAVRRVLPRLVPGSTAVVIGAGGLGAFAVQFLKVLTPARVIAVDGNPARLEYARELGADEAVAGVDGGTTDAILRATGGDGAEAVLDFVGVDETIAAGVPATRRRGAYGCIGAAGGTFRRPWYGGLPNDGEVFNFQGSTIADAREVVALAEAGLVRSDVERYPLERVAEAYEALEAGSLRGRAVIVP